MISESELKELNKKLALYFGIELDGRPRYRVVWTTNLLEKRRGVFEIFSGPIYLRTERGVKDTQKYSYMQNRYVLERILYYRDLKDEIINSDKGYYEPVWFFVDKDDNYLDPIWPVIERIIKALEAPKEWKTARQKEKEYISAEEDRVRKQIDLDTLLLHELGQDWKFYKGQGVFVDSTKRLT